MTKDGSIDIERPEDSSAAEAEADQAAAHAEQARARAVELRRLADELGKPGDAQGADAIEGDSPDGPNREPVDSSSRWRRPRRPQRKAIAMTAGLLVVCVSLAASGFVWRQHRTAMEERQRAAEYVAVARADLMNLMSIDFTTARDGVQRVIDHSTGRFKDEFQSGADDLVTALQQSKVTTTVTTDAAAVQSMTMDSAAVLVAATSVAASLGAPPRPPKHFRVLVRLQRDNGSVKVSEVEFVR